MKVYNKEGEHVKTVPKKFGVFSDRFLNLNLELDKKRLSDSDRGWLDMKLIYFYFSKYMSCVDDMLVDGYVSNNIDRDYIPELRKVQRNDGTHDFELYFAKGNSVRVSRSDFPECVYTMGFRY